MSHTSGSGVVGWPATPADSQSVAHVSAQAPRTLLLTGRHDSKVDPQRNSAMLAQLLRRPARGDCAQTVIVLRDTT